MCSKKSTGLSSRIEAYRSVFASRGVAGATIFSPGTAWNQAIGIWEWIAPNWLPAPTVDRTVSGSFACSLERYLYLAA